jgi:hypothetical protein
VLRVCRPVPSAELGHISSFWTQGATHIEQYSQIFGCEIGLFPFRYLGIPMNHKKLNKDWMVVEDRFQKKLSSFPMNHKKLNKDWMVVEDRFQKKIE